MSSIKTVAPCRYCGEELELQTGIFAGIWIHRITRSIYCDVEIVGRDDVKGAPS